MVDYCLVCAVDLFCCGCCLVTLWFGGLGLFNSVVSCYSFGIWYLCRLLAGCDNSVGLLRCLACSVAAWLLVRTWLRCGCFGFVCCCVGFVWRVGWY